MHVYSADALVLRTYRYGEADRIVVFLTEDRGKKRGVAKNASRSRRRFGAALEPLTRGRATYVEREHRDLVRLDRVEPSQMPFGSGSATPDPDGAHRLGHAAYFAELVDEWAPENAPNERLFRLGAAVAGALVGAQSVDALARYFEYWLLRLEGVYPAIDRCPRCGRDTFGAGAAFVVADRVYVCRNCSAGGLKLSAEAVGFLRTSGRLTPVDAAAAVVDAGPLREIEQAHHALMALHLDKELRSARVVRELRPAT
ncbi:MAG TPA: DNA repair protein RecO [Vicinamibacterales bacterium]|nr:DNA repair protein RecO [Vicinamibacterales bacterium]